VTLNITLLTSGAFYQSSDFRLVDLATNQPCDDHSNKSVPISCRDWLGSLTFTGIGSWDHHEMSELAASWIVGADGPTPSEVAEIVRLEAQKLFDVIQRQLGKPQRHSFILTDFHEARAELFVISNFQNAYGTTIRAPDTVFNVTSQYVKAGGAPRLVVTGMSGAVTRLQREHLLHLAREYRDDSARIRRALRSVNAVASESRESHGLISRECSSISLRPDGSMASELGREGARAGHQLFNGIDLGAQLEQLFLSQGLDPTKMRVLQSATSGAPRNRPEVTASAQQCHFVVSTPEGGSSYVVQELSSSEFELRSARSVSHAGLVVGSGSMGANQPDWIPWIWKDGVTERLGYIGYAIAVIDGPSVLGDDLSDPVAVTGIRWNGRSASRVDVDYLTADGLECVNSQFLAMNTSGVAAGFVGAQPSGKGWIHHEAAALLPDNTFIVAPLPEGTLKTKGVAINDSGLVLVSEQVGWFEQHLYLWNLADQTCIRVNTSGFGNVVPIGLDARGRILGQGRDSTNRILAAWGEIGGHWVPLGTPAEYAPAATNARGDVVGTYQVDGVERPWLLRSSGEMQFLPFVREHHCHPSSINDACQIVGEASADHGSHALLWTPPGV